MTEVRHAHWRIPAAIVAVALFAVSIGHAASAPGHARPRNADLPTIVTTPSPDSTSTGVTTTTAFPADATASPSPGSPSLPIRPTSPAPASNTRVGAGDSDREVVAPSVREEDPEDDHGTIAPQQSEAPGDEDTEKPSDGESSSQEHTSTQH